MPVLRAGHSRKHFASCVLRLIIFLNKSPDQEYPSETGIEYRTEAPMGAEPYGRCRVDGGFPGANAPCRPVPGYDGATARDPGAGAAADLHWPGAGLCRHPERLGHQDRHAADRDAAIRHRRHARPDGRPRRAQRGGGAGLCAWPRHRLLRQRHALRQLPPARLRRAAEPVPRRAAPAAAVRPDLDRAGRAGADRGDPGPQLGALRPDATGRHDQHDQQAPHRAPLRRGEPAGRLL